MINKPSRSRNNHVRPFPQLRFLTFNTQPTHTKTKLDIRKLSQFSRNTKTLYRQFSRRSQHQYSRPSNCSRAISQSFEYGNHKRSSFTRSSDCRADDIFSLKSYGDSAGLDLSWVVEVHCGEGFEDWTG